MASVTSRVSGFHPICVMGELGAALAILYIPALVAAVLLGYYLGGKD